MAKKRTNNGELVSGFVGVSPFIVIYTPWACELELRHRIY
ncbi:hypothetical protein EMIT0P291_250021 [Pseudomonas sp. IT-P291]